MPTCRHLPGKPRVRTGTHGVSPLAQRTEALNTPADGSISRRKQDQKGSNWKKAAAAAAAGALEADGGEAAARDL